MQWLAYTDPQLPNFILLPNCKILSRPQSIGGRNQPKNSAQITNFATDMQCHPRFSRPGHVKPERENLEILAATFHEL